MTRLLQLWHLVPKYFILKQNNLIRIYTYDSERDEGETKQQISTYDA